MDRCIGFHARERDFRRSSKGVSRFCGFSIGGRLRDGIDLLFAGLIAGLKTTCGCNVRVDHRGRRDDRPFFGESERERVLNECLFEECGAIEEVVPAPAGSVSCGGEIKEVEFAAYVNVGAPYSI